MESIRVKHAESATILIVSNARENVPQQYLVAVALVEENILPLPDEGSQIFNLLRCDVDEMKLAELRLYSQRVERASGNKFFCCFRKVLPCTSKSINVDVEE